jgi:hypothetical protein
MTAMNCTDFKAEIGAAIENRLPLPREMPAHLATCCDASCRTEWEEAVLLDGAVASWRRARPTIDVTDAVVSGWRAGEFQVGRATVSAARTPGRPATPSRSAAARTAVAIAAAVVVLLTVALLSPDPDFAIATRGTNTPPVNNPAGDAGLAYVTYAQNAAQIVTDAVVLTLGGGEQMEDAKVEPIGLGWDADWPPMGEVRAALDDLLDSLPADPPPS